MKPCSLGSQSKCTHPNTRASSSILSKISGNRQIQLIWKQITNHPLTVAVRHTKILFKLTVLDHYWFITYHPLTGTTQNYAMPLTNTIVQKQMLQTHANIDHKMPWRQNIHTNDIDTHNFSKQTLTWYSVCNWSIFWRTAIHHHPEYVHPNWWKIH